MTHYVVVVNWAYDDMLDTGNGIIGVAHTLEEAKEIFNKQLAEEKEIVEDNNWTIFEDCEMEFDAGEDGYYAANHIHLYIQGVM